MNLGHKKNVNSLCFKDSQELLSGSDDQSFKIWKIFKSTKPIKDVLVYCKVNCVNYSHKQKMIVSAGDDEIVRIWDAFTLDCIANLEGHIGNIWSAYFSPCDNYVLSSSQDRSIKIWDLDDFQCIRTHNIEDAGQDVKAFYSPDGQNIALTQSNGNIQLLRVKNFSQKQILEGHLDRVVSLHFFGDNKLLTGSNDCTIRYWDMNTGTCEQVITGHLGAINCVSHLNSQVIVSASNDFTIRVWKL